MGGMEIPKEIENTGMRVGLQSLPPELHVLISKHLTYPDALSLKHSSRAFYDLVYTGVNLKIEWLIDRRKLHLDCPHDKGCELGSDLTFCRGSVRYVFLFVIVLGDVHESREVEHKLIIIDF